ncbi:protein EARLY FLOWERING 4-like [Macadamia integrifolia]|uniref:protein EARLY FLOWERING 4-like n=1 Tax=Macadamia integrifolia TaxID=60698 RepID=UPI001C501B91|nr:protein EARLY FLOWERING 4-like [Macadamia integrifolia]XP_042514917.1 protein EARLY FLOWERING 4-like [Macadamia integrifolia]XP_042514918.1 protein EARLY FLOWERING 4-like [Macadamia integrifolia]
MTTVDSFSAAESSMDDSSPDQQLLQQSNLNLQNRIYGGTNKRRRSRGDGNGIEDHGGDKIEDDAGEGDVEVWKKFNESFKQIQSVLDQNRLLIQQVNENHQSKIPDNLAKNVGLIREINGNISKVVSLYSDLSSNFSSVFHQRRGMAAKSSDTDNVSN